MSCHIVVITTPYLRQYMDDACGDYPEDITYHIEEYRTFSELGDIYLRNEDKADGFLTSGIVAQTAIERSVSRPLKPVISLGEDQESIYKVALELLIGNRELDPGRIVFDVFVDVVPDPSILALIKSQSLLNTYPEFQRWLSQATSEELYDIEDRTIRRIKKLWDEDRIDVVICRYSSIVPHLKELGIPCVFASATDDYARLSIRRLMAQIELRRINTHHPAVISVVSDRSAGQFWDERQKKELKKALLGFSEKYDVDFVLQEDSDQFLLLTDKAVLSYLTDDFTRDHLFAELGNLDFKAYISYGIGATINRARENAEAALRESEISGGIHLIDEDLRLIGPLNTETAAVASTSIVTPRIQEIARQASLSAVTVNRIHRLIRHLDRKELTSEELAAHLHVTTRNANRILKHLEESGFIRSVRRKSGHMRGRPAKIYRFEWDI